MAEGTSSTRDFCYCFHELERDEALRVALLHEEAPVGWNVEWITHTNPPAILGGGQRTGQLGDARGDLLEPLQHRLPDLRSNRPNDQMSFTGHPHFA